MNADTDSAVRPSAAGKTEEASVVTLYVDAARQTLSVREGDSVVREYPVSTARNGLGEADGSECTPRGHHSICAMIGAGEPVGAVFVGRKASGEIYSPELAERDPQRDWILSRILWLTGMQPGYNRLGLVDSMRRYIYIHGTPDSEPMGVPRSHGCIRMRNADVIDLFQRVAVGVDVFIGEGVESGKEDGLEKQ